ncbi:hypothetical protein K458DRAFT_311100 [Lentithecium fluviatile CBS 122367]|uniref:Uncharacterized protein n=1 Tax=Lentithecium fluviatile CBS 122367 TaxID=1168545 RepID=A0A6G1IRL9_9PLEO|nr:hypothetical protein K458DRAFT_311100 [Lentithecium fluviatile CBS 122367]
MIFYAFIHVEPFKRTLLQYLRPFDIAKLLEALGCSLGTWERNNHMDLLDDIFHDSKEISLIRNLGMTVRIFGADLGILESRLKNPRPYLQEYGETHPLHVFVLVTDTISNDTEQISTMVRDFRLTPELRTAPEDMSVNELSQNFSPTTATNISTLSKWILCAPYLAGSLPKAIPGWVPVFNSQEHVNVWAYISTMPDTNARVLHMDRFLMRQVFGCQNDFELLSNCDILKAKYYALDRYGKHVKELRGKLTLNSLHDIFAADQARRGTSIESFTVYNTVHPLNSSIFLRLE